MDKLPLEIEIERDVTERKERDEALAAMQQLVIDEMEKTAAAKRMQEDGAKSHGKTALMCEKKIRELETQLAEARRERDELRDIVAKARQDFDSINAKAAVIAESLQKLKEMM